MRGAMPHLVRYVGKLSGEKVRTTIPQLEVFAIAQALICMSANFSGVDQGRKDAQNVFEEALKNIAPMPWEMPDSGSERKCEEK